MCGDAGQQVGLQGVEVEDPSYGSRDDDVVNFI